ncbi:aspartate/glutamate racemase family protein [Phenylobacterium sp.]|jgi:hypothetical protein|uniref:aspartate/glutamate racemase family protein n=1 Tax=Phenylobacterium sp. TaxID=1871053 RepID=UPI0037851BE3
MPRIALIHALRHSPAPIEAAFAELWPHARLANLLDESLSADLAAAGALDASFTDRFLALGRYARQSGADAVLFTCSAFAPCIDAVRADLGPLPVRSPYEAMIAEAAAIGGRIGLVATFAPTLATMPAEFPPELAVEPIFVDSALAALDAGDTTTHDRLVAEAVRGRAFDAVALAQYSLARAAPAVAAVMDAPVLTSPGAAVRELRRTMLGA